MTTPINISTMSDEPDWIYDRRVSLHAAVTVYGKHYHWHDSNSAVPDRPPFKF